MTATASQPHAKTFEAPYPGTKAMPRWDTGELISTWRATLFGREGALTDVLAH